jgi:hypothetical protein
MPGGTWREIDARERGKRRGAEKTRRKHGGIIEAMAGVLFPRNLLPLERGRRARFVGFCAGGTPALHYFAATSAGGNDTLSRPCRATLAAQAGEGKAGGVTGGKFHGSFHEQVFTKKCDEETALGGGGWSGGARRGCPTSGGEAPQNSPSNDEYSAFARSFVNVL